MNSNKQLAVIMLLVVVMTVPGVAFARSPLQRRSSRWTGIEFPQGRSVDVRFIVVNPAVVRAFPRESWPASEAPSQSADEPEYDPSHADSGPEFAAWAKITREGTSTSIKVSMYRLPRNKTYYLYVIDPSGTPVQIFKLNRSGYETSTWNRSTEPGTFMLALSMSDRLTDIETDKNVFMTSETPDGFSIVPKNP